MDFMGVVGGAGGGGARPTFFELAAQATLTDLVKPALRQVLAVRARRAETRRGGPWARGPEREALGARAWARGVEREDLSARP